MFLISFVLIALLVNESNEAKYLTAKLLYPANNIFAFEFGVGQPKMVIEGRIEQTMNISVISPYTYSVKTSRTATFIQNETVKITHNPTNLPLYLDDISIEDKSSKIMFYLFPPKNSYDIKKNRIGFSLKVNEESVSFIHQLKKNGKISKLQYSFNPTTNSEEGLFYIGGIPNDVINKNKYKAELKVNTNYSYWSVNLTKIHFDNITFDNTQIAYFDSGNDYIYLPEEYYNTLDITYFERFQNDCSKVSFFEVLFMFVCNVEILSELPPFNFEFNDYEISIEAYRLFTYLDGNYVLDMRKNSGNNNIILGGKFLKHFISTFDYENKKVTLYSDINPIIYKGKDPRLNYMPIIYLICSVISFMGIFAMVLVYLMNKNCFIRVNIEIHNEESNK